MMLSVAVDASRNVSQERKLPFCTTEHFITCEDNEVEREKCQRECPNKGCDQDVYELAPANLHNDEYADSKSAFAWLTLIMQKDNQYPAYTEVYAQSWESFLGELGECAIRFSITVHNF